MKIITSTTAHDTYFRVLAQMKKLRGENIVIIAPDRFTASVERGIIETLGIESTMNVEVMSFMRLADRYIGGEIDRCLTPEGSVMLIAKVISDCLKDGSLGYYRDAARAEGFASELYAALTAIRNSGISTDKLSKAAAASKSNTRRQKLFDIITVYKGYLAALQNKFSDSTTRLEQLEKYIAANGDKFAATHYFCTDINEFSEPELAILRQLSLNAGSLTIGLESGVGNPNERVYPDRVIQKLRSLTPDKVTVESYRDDSVSPAVDAISRYLFSYRRIESVEENDGFVTIKNEKDGSYEVLAPNDGFVTLRRVKDRSEEALALALDVLKRVRNGGRYSDFEVYATDLKSYAREIENVFKRYGIRYYIDRREPLVKQVKVRYVLQAIECVRSGLARRETLDFVKNPLFAATVDGGEEAVFKFENHLLANGVSPEELFESFDDSDIQKSQNKEFNSSKCDDKPQLAQYSAQERVRLALIERLAPLLALTSAPAPIADFVAAVREMLKFIEPAAERVTAELGEIDVQYLKCAEQTDRKTESVLDEIERVLDYETDIADFEGIITGMLKTLTISLVPPYLDCVFVGDADSRFMGDGDIYVLGATNDKLPPASSGGTVLNIRDEEALRELNVPIVPDSQQKALAEKFAVLDLFKKPRGRLVISYPETGSDSLLRPATAIDELKSLLCEGGERIKEERPSLAHLADLDADTLENLLFTEESCAYQTISVLDGMRAEDAPYVAAAKELTYASALDRARPHLVPDRVIPVKRKSASISVSKLETLYSCPYRYFFQYGLKLFKRKEGVMLGTEYGTILHAVLENFFKGVIEGKTTAESDIEEIVGGIFDGELSKENYRALMRDPTIKKSFLRLKEESIAVCKELFKRSQRSEFRPSAVEKNVEDFSDTEFDVDGEKVKLSGIIDRIDMCGDKFVIIDYKSFKKDLDFEEIYFGRKLQLLVYMRAVERGYRQGKNLIPCGVFYLPIYADFDKEGTNRLKYKGYASADMDTLKEMDENVGAPDSAIPLEYDKDGNLKSGAHLTREEFDILGDYAMELARRGASLIKNGYIKPLPSATSCNYCDYNELCAYKNDGGATRSGSAPKMKDYFAACGQPAKSEAEEENSDGEKNRNGEMQK